MFAAHRWTTVLVAAVVIAGAVDFVEVGSAQASAAAAPDISSNTALKVGSGFMTTPSISPDGGFVALISNSSDVPGHPTSAKPHVWVVSPTGQDVPIDPTDTNVDGPADPQVSANGRYVTFSARRDYGNDNNGVTVYRADVISGIATKIGSEPSSRPSISADGRYVAYQTDPLGSDKSLIKVWDASTGAIATISDGSGNSVRPAISGNGQVVAFDTEAKTPGAPAGVDFRSQAVVWSRASGTISLVAQVANLPTTIPLTTTAVTSTALITGLTTTGTQAREADRASQIDSPQATSFDGRYVAFLSTADASEFVTGVADRNARSDVFVRDLTANVTRVASLAASGKATCLGESTGAAIADGGQAIFESTCADLGVKTPLPAGGRGVWTRTFDEQPAALLGAVGGRSIDNQLVPAHASLSSDGSQAAFSTIVGSGAAAGQTFAVPTVLYSGRPPTVTTPTSSPPPAATSTAPPTGATVSATTGSGTTIRTTTPAVSTSSGPPTARTSGATTPVSTTVAGNRPATGTSTPAITSTPPADVDAHPLMLEIAGPDVLFTGAVLTLFIRFRNYSKTRDLPGPRTFSVLLPNGMPAGYQITATPPDGNGWRCTTTPFGQRITLTCTTSAGVARDSTSPTLPLTLTGVAIFPGSQLPLPFSYDDGGQTVTKNRPFATAAPQIAKLSVSGAAPEPLLAGQRTNITISGHNDGNGTATGTQAAMTLPSGVSASGAVGAGWSCAVQGQAQACSNNLPVAPGADVPPLVLSVSGAATLVEAKLPVAVTASFTASKATNSTVITLRTAARAAVSVLSINRTDLPAKTTDNRVATYHLVVHNAGDHQISGILTATETGPPGSVLTATGTAWSCRPTGPTVTCTRPTTLAVQADAPALTVTATFPPQYAGGNAQLAGTAMLDGSNGAQAAAIAVPAALRPAEVTATAVFGASEVIRDDKATITLGALNAGSVASSGSITVGLLLPAGMTPIAAGGGGWSCRYSDATKATAPATGATAPATGATGGGAVICNRSGQLLPQAATAGAIVEVTVGTRTASAEVTVGTMTATNLDAGLGRLLGDGAAVLTRPGISATKIVDLLADAGPNQQVPERTPVAGGMSATGAPVISGLTAATVVTLDGTLSSAQAAGVGKLAWAWRQTAGPGVRWTVTGPREATSPEATGERPTFSVPRLTGDTSVTLSFELTVTAGAAKAKKTVHVVVTPTPDAAPVLGNLTSNRNSYLPNDKVDLSLPLTDPEDDTVSVTWSVQTNGTGEPAKIFFSTSPLQGKAATAVASFKWPKGASFAEIQAIATSARGAQTTAALTIGKSGAPPTVTLTASRSASDDSATATATVTGNASAVTWSWSQKSGPKLANAALAAANGPTFSFALPAVAQSGQAIELTVKATRGGGLAAQSAVASTSITLVPVAPPTLAVTGSLAVATNVTTALTVTGVPTGSTVSWIQRAGPAGTFGSAAAATTTFAAKADGTASLAVDVTDPSGRVSSVGVDVRVGTISTPQGSGAGCAVAGSVLNLALEAARSNHALALTVGPVNLDLGHLAVVDGCPSTTPSVTFTGAGFSIAGGTVSGTELQGAITATTLCLTKGELKFPDSWGLTKALLGPSEPVCVDLTPGAVAVSGSLKVIGLPLLKLPASATKPELAVVFRNGLIHLETTFQVPGAGSATVKIDINSTTGTYSGSADGLFTVLDRQIALKGSLTWDGKTLTTNITGSVAGPINIAGTATVSNLTLTWSPDGLALSGDVAVNDSVGKPAVTLSAVGKFTDTKNFSLSLSGGAGWSPVAGVAVPNAGFIGSVVRTNGVTDFDVSVVLTEPWKPSSAVTVTNVTARLSNAAASPESCPTTIPLGNVWLAITGAATVTFGSSDVSVSVQACVAPGTKSWSISSNGTAEGWQPLAAPAIAVNAVGVKASSDSKGSVNFSAYGTVTAYGAILTASVSVADGAVLVDATGVLKKPAGVTLLDETSGHIIYTSAARPGYQLQTPGSGAPPTRVDVAQGISLYASYTLRRSASRSTPPDRATVPIVVADQLGLTGDVTVLLSGNLGNGVPVFRASLDFGQSGITIYQNCDGHAVVAGSDAEKKQCTRDNRTRLALTKLTLSLSAAGQVAFDAGASLDIAASGSTPASALTLTARLTIDIVGPKITIALVSTGVWKGALGKDGLDLSNLAIQAGLDFSAGGLPIPSVGVSASIDSMPQSWRDAIGMEPGNSEPIAFVLNVSVASPIIDIEIGIKNNKTVLDPLKSFAKGTLLVDYGSLVIAPFGGTLGDKTYKPGLSFGLAATISGVPVDAAFALDVVAQSITGEFSVGEFSMGGLTVNKLAGKLTIDPKAAGDKFKLDLTGGVLLPSFGTGDDRGSANGHINVTAGTNGFHAAIDVRAKNIGVAGVARLDVLELTGSIEVGKGSPSFTLKLTQASGTVLGTKIKVSGAIEFSNGNLDALALQATVDLTYGPASLTGPGCAGAGTGSGACMNFSYGSGEFVAEIDATLKVSGFELAIDGSITPEKIAAHGTLTLPVGTFEIGGTFYTAAGKDADKVAVMSGDFDFAAAVSTASFNGFEASVDLAATRRGNNVTVAASGSVTTALQSVKIKTNFAYQDGELTYDIRGKVDLTLFTAKIASASVHIARTRTSFLAEVAGDISLKYGGFGFSGAANGTFSAKVDGKGVTYAYDIAGNVSLLLPGLSLNGNFTAKDGAFTLVVALDGTVFSGRLDASLSAAGYLHATGIVTVAGVSGFVVLENPNKQWRLDATLTYDGRTLATAKVDKGTFTAMVDFQFAKSGSINLFAFEAGADFRGRAHLVLSISQNGATKKYSVNATFSGELRVQNIWFWVTGSTYYLGGFGVTLKNNGDACAQISSHEVCT